MDHLRVVDRMQAMTEALARKLSGYFPVTETTTALMSSLCDQQVEFAPGDVIVGQEAPHTAIYLIDNGWALRARNMENGARQIVSVALPGDFVGLNALLFPNSDFEHTARTNVAAFRIDPERARQAFHSVPNLSAALFWANAHEESILAERIVSLGRRSARVRTAHVLCEFVARLEILEEARFPELALPISQEDFADILGISLVHMNKILRALDREGVITFRNGMLFLHDQVRLRQIAGFDAGYLHFTRRNQRLVRDG